jgi:hypothetical protein
MQVTTCDVSQGSVVIAGAHRHDDDVEHDDSERLVVAGSVQRFDHITFPISVSFVLVVGSNLLSSCTADHFGLECSRWSNISLHGAPAGTLTASGGSLASEIGAGAQGAWLTVANESCIASGSAQASVLPSCSIC